MSKKHRYTPEEHLKINYYKARIKEIPYLEHSIKLYSFELNRIKDKKEKEKLSLKINDFQKNLDEVHEILNSLSDISRNIAEDLLINKIGVENIKQKYFSSNPHQTLNDELKDI